ncbi:MAG: pseudaminic acid cytidylyltransferase [Lachnospiraceae bacterium]|nr:pseudaminic acid cytidylyltransferase [Lachnospiraceae bacterium]
MGVLAIIPARGGSKRIPRKNIREFCGKPIICYSIEAALQSGVFDEVMVSTDEEEIAEIARKSGASVPFFRSPESANDHATISDVIREVLENYKARGREFDAYAVIYATAPMIRPEYLRQGWELLSGSEAGFLLPVVKYSYPPQRSYHVREGLLEWNDASAARKRSQDLEPWYHDCGMFSFARVEAFYHTRPEERRKLPLVLDESVIQDIDTEEDWKMAELKWRLLAEQSPKAE